MKPGAASASQALSSVSAGMRTSPTWDNAAWIVCKICSTDVGGAGCASCEAMMAKNHRARPD